MRADARKIDWGFAGPVIGFLGMLMAIAGGWMSFESRVTANETATQEIKGDISDIKGILEGMRDRELQRAERN